MKKELKLVYTRHTLDNICKFFFFFAEHIIHKCVWLFFILYFSFLIAYKKSHIKLTSKSVFEVGYAVEAIITIPNNNKLKKRPEPTPSLKW